MCLICIIFYLNVSDRRDARECLGVPEKLEHTSCNLSDFLFWLDGLNSANARALIKQVLSWLAMILENGGWRDALVDDVLRSL